MSDRWIRIFFHSHIYQTSNRYTKLLRDRLQKSSTHQTDGRNRNQLYFDAHIKLQLVCQVISCLKSSTNPILVVNWHWHVYHSKFQLPVFLICILSGAGKHTDKPTNQLLKWGLQVVSTKLWFSWPLSF